MSDSIPQDFPTILSREVRNLFVGDQLGRGAGREVYEMKTDETKVIKIEVGSGCFQNIIEWETWQLVKGIEHLKHWFAPCHNLSPCGLVLLQERTETLPKSYPLPARLPAIFTDTKKANFGLLDGKLVCHDYGASLVRGVFYATKKNLMKKVEWW